MPLIAFVFTAPTSLRTLIILIVLKTPVVVSVLAPTFTFKKKSFIRLIISLNPLKVVSSLKPSLKPKEIIDLSIILFRFY
jgi:hypothetical protein